MARSQRKGNGLPAQLAAVNWHAAGIDIGSQEHWVAVPPDCDPQPVRRFGACTADLEALATWLRRVWRDDGSDGIYGRVLDSPL